MILNRAAVERSIPIPQQALMHDYWIGIIVAKYGYIDFLPEQTIFYRQHEQNEVGAKRVDLQYIFGKINSSECWKLNTVRK